MTRHGNISIFVPHLGCPVRCSFCNQNEITGRLVNALPRDVDDAVCNAMRHENYNPGNTEIAFFGGSFTAIDKGVMLPLLQAAYNHVKRGNVTGIRLSTRPDAIDDGILKTLKSYGVTAIELGAQSMDDAVLLANRRGHDAAAVVTASELIRSYGFSLGLQMMTGLYKDTDEKAVETAKKLIALKPDCVRIYPTLVLKGTRLEELVNSGVYSPQTLEAAVSLAAKLIVMFENNGIDVIRIGLHDVERESFYCGPWHPAFGELCENEIFLNILKGALQKPGAYTVYCPQNAISKVKGHKQRNIEILRDLGYNLTVTGDASLSGRQLKVAAV